VSYIDKNIIFLSDYKSYLQELVQTDQKSVEYRVINESGPAHNRTFEVEVIIDNIVFATGTGKSKKAAEQNAAKKAIELSAGGNL
jgi:ribonuclease-3